MKKYKIIPILAILLLTLTLTGCCLSHEWVEATCTAPRTCAKCEKTEGELLPHTWEDATCTDPKTCKECGATEGETLPHTWAEATCTAPETCGDCGKTQGEALGHVEGEVRQGEIDCVKEVSYQNVHCERCDEVIDTQKKKLTNLRDGGMFLMSPQEFTDRLNAAFRSLYLSNYKAELGMGADNDDILVLVTRGNAVIGNVNFYDTHLEDAILPFNQAEEQRSFNMVLALIDKDTEVTVRLVSAILMAVDPSLDMYEDNQTFQKVGTAVLSRSRYEYNKILYMYNENSGNVNQLGLSLYDE